MNERSLQPWRKRVAATARTMAELGLTHWSSGNVSARVGGQLVITPSGVPYGRLQPRQIVALDLAGNVAPGAGVPSSEWRLHVALYRAREDIKCVVHTHSPAATAAACRGELVPVTHEARIFLGDRVPVSSPAPPGSWELAEAVSRSLGDGCVALIGKHGAVTVGDRLERALALAVLLEEAARTEQAAPAQCTDKEK
ncbi:MAG: class II aldolase/adducin family protein [Candidatus Bipolaricaulota bacterium]